MGGWEIRSKEALAVALGVLLGIVLGARPAESQDAESQDERPDAGEASGLLSAVADVWLRSHAFVWEGPRATVQEAAPPRARPISVSRDAVIAVTDGLSVRAADLERAQKAFSLSRYWFEKLGWRSPVPQPLQLYLVRDGQLAEPVTQVRELFAERDLDRASVFVTLERGLFAFDPEACSVMAYALAMLRSLDPAEGSAWRQATARTLTRDLVGRVCTQPFASRDEEPLADARVLEAIQAAASLRQLWELGRQWTWEGAGVRASPDLWEVLAYVVQGQHQQRLPDDVWRQFTERLLLARRRDENLATHPPFADKTRRVWGDLQGLAPLGVEGVRFAASAGAPFQLWLRGEPGTRWLLLAETRNARGQVLTRFISTSKNQVESSAEVVVFHPLEAPTGTESVVVWVGNMGAQVRALATPGLEHRAFHLVISR